MCAKKITQSDLQIYIERSMSEKHSALHLEESPMHAVGMVLSGHKNIYNDSQCTKVEQSSLFFLSSGQHYVRNVAGKNKPYMQIVFRYTPHAIRELMTNLRFDFGFELNNPERCPRCHDPRNIVFKPAAILQEFFTGLSDRYLQTMASDPALRRIKISELTCLLLSHGNCCLRQRFLECADSAREGFDHIIRRNIFADKTIDEIAVECNRSLTSFKQEFKRYYGESPRRWLTRQRLIHAGILLLSGGMSVSQVGNECCFPNTSHFIKLFKKEFGLTPAVYRGINSHRRQASYSQAAV